MKNKTFQLTIAIFLCTSLVACNSLFSSSGDQANQDFEENSSPKKETIPKAINDFKTIMNQNPGKYSGNQYNEEAVKKELDNLPSNLSNEEYLDYLVYLLGENYQPHYATIQAVDPTIRVNQATPEEAIPQIGKINVQIILDASGSMAGKVSGGQKMDLAKKAIKSFAAGLPKEANVSLRVYGHKGSNSDKDKSASCQSNEVVYPMSPYSEANFNNALNQFQPTGWTPLASAIQAAKQDMEKDNGENVKNIVYVVSDGVETCGGNPVEAANGEFKFVYTQRDLESYLESQKKRLEMEWKYWGYSSGMEVFEIWSEKQRVLETSRVGIDKLKREEEERILKAVQYLEQVGKIKDRIPLSELARKRGTFISRNNWDESMRVSGALNQARKKEEDRLKKMEEEGKKSL